MTTYDTDERSVSDSRPIELFDFAFSTITYRYTSYSRNYTYLGNVYTASPVQRGAITVVNSQDVPEPPIELPIYDPVVVGYFGGGVPPQKFIVTITRVQQTSGQAKQQATGPATCSVRGRTAVIKISPVQANAMQLMLPVAEMSRLCNHVLYDALCTGSLTGAPNAAASRTSNQVATTIASIAADRRSITVGSIGGFAGSGDFQFGEFLHNASQERRSIVTHTTGTAMTLDVRLRTTMLVGDAITIFRGCSRAPVQCRDKFSNIPNFGGHPQLISTGYIFVDIARNRS